jgi:hypothetical protein
VLSPYLMFCKGRFYLYFEMVGYRNSEGTAVLGQASVIDGSFSFHASKSNSLDFHTIDEYGLEGLKSFLNQVSSPSAPSPWKCLKRTSLYQGVL